MMSDWPKIVCPRFFLCLQNTEHVICANLWICDGWHGYFVAHIFKLMLAGYGKIKIIAQTCHFAYTKIAEGLRIKKKWWQQTNHTNTRNFKHIYKQNRNEGGFSVWSALLLSHSIDCNLTLSIWINGLRWIGRKYVGRTGQKGESSNHFNLAFVCLSTKQSYNVYQLNQIYRIPKYLKLVVHSIYLH